MTILTVKTSSNSSLYKGSDILYITKEPIIFKHNDNIYRKVVMYRDRYISEDGDIIKVVDGKVVPLNNPKGYIDRYGYRNTSVYDLACKKYISIRIHRMVALAWLENDDYVVKNNIDHIDGNKLNNQRHNLRWVSSSNNSAAGRYNGSLDNFYLLDIIDNAIVNKRIVPSLTASRKLTNSNDSNTGTNDLPKLYLKEDGVRDTDMLLVVREQYEEGGDNGMLTAYLDLKYPIHVSRIDGTGKTRVFQQILELVDAYDLSPKLDSLRAATKQLKVRGYNIKMLNKHPKNTYDVKNIETGEEHTGLSRTGAAKIVGCGPASVMRRCYLERQRGVPMNGWVLKYGKDEEYPISKDNLIARYKYICTKGSEVLEFDTLEKLAKHFDRGVTTLRIYLNTTPWNGWSIKTKKVN